MNQMTPRRSLRADADLSISPPDLGRWQRRQSLYRRRAARANQFARRGSSTQPSPTREARLDTLADQQHAALRLLLATPAPTLGDAITKLELYVAELPDVDNGAEVLRHILADLQRLT